MDQEIKTRENRLRRLASRLGYRIEKSRVRNTHINNKGMYQVVTNFNSAVLGVNYDATLDDVEDYLAGFRQWQTDRKAV